MKAVYETKSVTTVLSFCSALFIALLTIMLQCLSFRANAECAESYLRSDETLGNFADDKVIVVMNDDHNNIITYGSDDFAEVELTQVEELTQPLKDILINNREEEYDGIFVKENFRSILCLTLKNKGQRNVIDAIRLLRDRSDILSAEPDYLMEAAGSVNDPHYNKLWALNDRAGINVKDAWDITTGSADVKVRIIDSGIDASHPDLTNRVNRELSREFSDTDTLGPQNPLRDDYISFDGSRGHGTKAAGIIGAQANNGIGITGVCQDVELISLKMYLYDNSFAFINLINAIVYAISNRIWILNFSMQYAEPEAALVKPNIENFKYILYNYGGLFVVSAGNYNKNLTENSRDFPACVDDENLIVVGAIDSSENRWVGQNQSSNYGANVDIYAPGDTIYTTNIDNTYESVSGTSYAAPYVAGVAALMMAVNSDLRGRHLKKLISENSDTISIRYGNGETAQVKKLNAFKAVSAAKSYRVN